MVKVVIGFAHASLASTLSPHQYRIKALQRGMTLTFTLVRSARRPGLGPLARFDKLNTNQQSNKQKTNNDQQIAAFQITNPGKNAALTLIKQIHVMQFYITEDFTELL
jgi:hypothetical protein